MGGLSRQVGLSWHWSQERFYCILKTNFGSLGLLLFNTSTWYKVLYLKVSEALAVQLAKVIFSV